MAHKSAILNKGKTIAVIASGFNNIYPKENIELVNKIIKNKGCIISEYPPETEVDLSNFPKRNRIIAGLSMGVLVIEAKYRSGSSITAKYAKNQNKPVFCMPNSIDVKNSVGTNNLIKKGAKLITDENDILKQLDIKVQADFKKVIKEINFEEIKKQINLEKIEKEINLKKLKEKNILENVKKNNHENKKMIPNEYKNIYNIIKNKPENINNISKKAKLTISQTNQILTMMEIENLIKRLPSNEFKAL